MILRECMPLPTPHFAALRYLDYWFHYDRANFDDLQHDDPEIRRQALVRIATQYGVHRNLPVEAENGYARLQLACDLLEDICAAQFENHYERVIAFTGQLHDVYGADVLSAASKFLWHKTRSPIILYDGRGVGCLREMGYVIADGDYNVFVDQWRRVYRQFSRSIIAACRDLENVIQYSWNLDMITANVTAELAEEEWFRERVFDFMLWHSQGPF